MTYVQPIIGHHAERGTVCLILRAMPFMQDVGHFDLAPSLAREMAKVLLEEADSAEGRTPDPITAFDIPAGDLRIRVRRRPFDPFYHYECPAHPEVGEGTFQDVSFAADAARRHYEQEHAA